MFRVARRLLSSDVTTVAQFTNVNSFKHMKAPRKVKEAFLIKPNLNYLKKLSLKNAGKDEKLDKLDTLAPSLTHIPSPLGQKDPIASVHNTIDAVFVITEAGRLFVQGKANYGMLGLGESVLEAQDMTEVKGMPPLQKVITSLYWTTALTKDGEVFAWGFQDTGLFAFIRQLSMGIGKGGNFATPQKVIGFDENTRIVDIACGNKHVIALDSEGGVWTWGNGAFGRLGHGNSTSLNKATRVELFDKSMGVHSVHASRSSTMVNSKVGAYSWGRNESGQLGVPSTMEIHDMEDIPRMVELEPIDMENPEKTTVPSVVGIMDLYGAAYSSATRNLYQWGNKQWSSPTSFANVPEPINPTKIIVPVGPTSYFFSDEHELFMLSRQSAVADPIRLSFPGEFVDVFGGHALGATAVVSKSLVDSLPKYFDVPSAPIDKAAKDSKNLFSLLFSKDK